MKAMLLAVLMLAPQAVAAQDLPFSMNRTLACLDGAAGPDARRACVGLSADSCIDTPAGGSTVGMAGCLDAERQYWDDRLNASYRALRARERASDADMAGTFGHVPLAPALRDMQRAWIGFRDATCAFEAAQWAGGTGQGPATLGCLLRMTGEQTLYLEQMLEVY